MTSNFFNIGVASYEAQGALGHVPLNVQQYPSQCQTVSNCENISAVERFYKPNMSLNLKRRKRKRKKSKKKKKGKNLAINRRRINLEEYRKLLSINSSYRLCLTFSPPIPLRLYTLPYRSNPPFLIFDIRALWRSVLSARAPECQKLKMAG